jgi:chloramphenicol-sensitive protein RarD
LKKDAKIGVVITFIAYTIWGFMPLYWNLLADITAMEIMCYRIVWSLVFLLGVFVVKGDWRRMFFSEAKDIVRNRKQILYVIAAALLITFNWFIFIWTVNSGHALDASLGYFINPLLNFVFAILFLGEKPGRSGAGACIIALVGVIIITVQTGQLPWPSLVLASTFSLYGLVKKKVELKAYTSLTLETLIMTPFALIYLIAFSPNGFMANGLALNLLSIGCGIGTALPLLMFAEATKRISYIAIGFIQYISPTITFLIAIFMLNESFSAMRLIGFIVIWISIIVFTVGVVKGANQKNDVPEML